MSWKKWTDLTVGPMMGVEEASRESWRIVSTV
jgi:hypothetical protein